MTVSSTSSYPPCPYCGRPSHNGKCPLVKAFEFHDDGVTIKRVEFFAPVDYSPPLHGAAGPVPTVNATSARPIRG